MTVKQSSPELSTLAAKIMNGYEPTREEIVSLAASVLSQDELSAAAEKFLSRAQGEPTTEKEE